MPKSEQGKEKNKINMKKIIMKVAAVCLVAGVVLTSCAKKGCTDSDATNYDSSATQNDGTCTFKAGVDMWFSTAPNVVFPGCGSVTYYVNGALIGSSAGNVYSISQPSCSGGAAHSSYDLGSAKTVTYSYKVVGDFPTGSSTGGDTTATLYQGSLNLNAHYPCFSLQLN